MHWARTMYGYGSAIFAGQAYSCAIKRFGKEPVYTCTEQPEGQKGPGCGGLPETGSAPCIGCPAGTTVAYDHCKTFPNRTRPSDLLALAQQAALAGNIAPLSGLKNARVYLFRGTKDTCYLDGTMNMTGAFFEPLMEDPSSQIKYQLSVPSLHAQPSIDPWVSPLTCGVQQPWAPPTLENCGYDGVGEALQHVMYPLVLQPPLSNNGSQHEANLLTFDQTLYYPKGEEWAGLATTGYVYIPPPYALYRHVGSMWPSTGVVWPLCFLL